MEELGTIRLSVDPPGALGLDNDDADKGSIEIDRGGSWGDGGDYSDDNDELRFDGGSNSIVLIVTPPNDDGWDDDKFSLILRSEGANLEPSPSRVRVTVEDDEVQPIAHVLQDVDQVD